jgi:hypothetical protein
MAEFSFGGVTDWLGDNSGWLGALAGGLAGSQDNPDQKTTNAPYMFQGQQEGINNFLNASKQQYGQGPQQYFPGNTVAGLDPSYTAGQNQQLGTINQQTGLANNMVSGVQNQLAGGDQVGGFQFQDQIGFGIDPSLQDAVTNPIMRNLQERMLPGLDLQATSQGAFGGSRAQQMKGQAVSDATGQMSDSIARANLQARQQSIGQRAGDIGAQTNSRGQDIQQNQYSNASTQWGLNAIPGAMNALQVPGQNVQNIGAQRNAYEQQLIDADKNRFDFNQQANLDNVSRLGQRMQMTPSGNVQTAQGAPANWATALGGAMTGYNLGNAFGTPAGNQPVAPSNPTGSLYDPNFNVGTYNNPYGNGS